MCECVWERVCVSVFVCVSARGNMYAHVFMGMSVFVWEDVSAGIGVQLCARVCVRACDQECATATVHASVRLHVCARLFTTSLPRHVSMAAIEPAWRWKRSRACGGGGLLGARRADERRAGALGRAN